jgi:putative two-component system response regulator
MNSQAQSVMTNRTILAIDDDAAIHKILDIHLSSAGYEVIHTTGGKDVFYFLEENSYDLVFCDIKMPEVDGLKVLEYVRKKSEHIPIIMLTGLVDVTLAVEIMKMGAFDYLIKPILKENLLKTVRNALTQSDLAEKNRKLEVENEKYRLSLEEKVKERTEQLAKANAEITSAYAELKSLNMQFALVLAETIEAKDQLTFGHCSRMVHLCSQVGKFLGLSETELEMLEYASLMHDIGKVTISDAILNKPGSLTSVEYENMKGHAVMGEKILGRIKPLQALAKLIGAHHEKYDGTGYPNGLKGEEIPLVARIISLVDTFDAMYADRAYRKGLPINVVLEELEKMSGTQLDPKLVEILIENKLYVLDETSVGFRSFMHITNQSNNT